MTDLQVQSKNKDSQQEELNPKRQKVDTTLQVLKPFRSQRAIDAAALATCSRSGPANLSECVASTSVLYQDKDFVVVSKPPDVRLDGDFDVTVEKLVHQLVPNLDKPRWIHQLDYATSGVIAVGLNRVAAGNAGRLFANRKTRKFYLAVVRGFMRPAKARQHHDAGQSTWTGFSWSSLPPTDGAGSLIRSKAADEEEEKGIEFKYGPSVAPISVKESWVESSCFFTKEGLLDKLYANSGMIPCFDVSGAIDEIGSNAFRMKIDPAGREARTQVVPIEYGFIDGQPVTKVLLRPIHGRRHQLRLHLLHLGFPIFGDATYGPVFCHETGIQETTFFQQSRMYLHALHLTLPFASSGLKVKSPKDSPFMGGKFRDLCISSIDPFILGSPI